MNKFTDTNGFFFYTDQEQSKKMRAWPSRAGLMALANEATDEAYQAHMDAIA